MPKHLSEHSAKSKKKTAPHKSPANPKSTASTQPIFGQPQPTPDPTGFRNPVTDQKDRGLNTLEAVPQPRGGAVEPTLTLAQVYGPDGAAKTQAIQHAGQIVFHSVGDTGSAKGPPF